MANRRFIDFPIAASVGDNDIVLIWQDGLNKQTTKATLLQGSPQSLAGLTDVDIAGLTNGQILQYNSTLGKWENVDRTDINLSELGDVTIVAPTNGQVLVYNSSTSKWENSSGGYVPYTGAVTTVNLGAQTIQAGSFVKAGGTSAQFLKANGSVDSTVYGTGSVTSVGLTMPSAFNVANSPVTTNGTLAVTGAGTVAQYIRGDGSLADFPATTGGGASVSYYLNGSVSQGTIGGVAYREVNRNPVFGTGTDISISSDGYIANFITDAGDPNKLEIPAGNWNLETYFSASSGGGNPSFYVELYKYNGSTFTLIASSATSPELIAFGTNLNPYFSTLAVPQTTLALTDRLALRFYVNTSGRTITLHTENDHLCQVITTFTTGLTALNGLTTQVQFFAVGTSGSDFNIFSATDTHTFNLPTASGTNRGALSSTDWTTFNNKENAITAGTTAQYFRGDKTFQTLNTSVVPEGTNLYYTEARVNANTNVAANTAARHNAVTLGTANGLSLSTQVLSLGLASAGVTGALSGTDWSTFNNKQNALTNPVTGTGTTNYLAKFTGTSTIGNSNIQDSGSQVTIGTGLYINAGTNTNVGNGIHAYYESNYAQVQLNGATGSLIDFSTSGTDFLGRIIYTNSTNLMDFHTSSAGTPRLSIGGNVIVNTNLLVGTTTDAGFRLDVNGTGRFSGNLEIVKSSNPYLIINDSGVASTGGILFQPTGFNAKGGLTLNFATAEQRLFTGEGGNTYFQTFYTNGVERLRITPTGNLGLGVTPSAGGLSGYVLFELANGGASIYSGPNQNLNGTNISWSGGTASYKISNFATLYNQQSGQHQWFNAPSGTAGNAITFTQAMTLTSGGNLLVGTTTDIGQRLQVSGGYITQVDGGVRTFLGYDGSGSLVGTTTNHYFRFITNDTERMRITSGGNVGIGSTTATGFTRTLKINTSSGTAGILLSDGDNDRAGFYIDSGTTAPAYLFTNNSKPLAINVAGAEAMRITSGGNVLIGTISDAGYRLEVAGVIRANGGQIIVNNVANNWLQSNQNGTSAQFQTWFASNGTTRRGYFGYPSGSSDNFTLMNEANGQMAFGTNSSTALTLAPTGAATFSSSVTAGGYLGGGANFTNIGQASNSPSNISANIGVLNNTFAFIDLSTQNADGGWIDFSKGNGSDYAGRIRYFNSSDLFRFYTNGGSSSMDITSGGNLLIGTTTDVGARLHVNGAVRTGAPSGGSAVNWRLGTARGGTVTTNATVRVEIDGALVDLVARYV
jgi:hypothetical protein